MKTLTTLLTTLALVCFTVVSLHAEIGNPPEKTEITNVAPAFSLDGYTITGKKVMRSDLLDAQGPVFRLPVFDNQKGRMKSLTGAEFDVFSFDVRVTYTIDILVRKASIAGAPILVKMKHPVQKKLHANGYAFTTEMRQFFESLDSGATIEITNIKALNPEGDLVTIDSSRFKLK